MSKKIQSKKSNSKKLIRSSDQDKWTEFFMIPNSVIDSGLLAKMKNSERSVYFVLCRHADHNSRLAFPAVKTLMELTGSAKETVCKATKQLVNYGVITKRRAPASFKYKMIYKIIKDPKINLDTSPWKKDKCKRLLRQKNGRFTTESVATDLLTSPCEPHSITSPCDTDQKNIKEDLRKKERILKKESRKSKPFSEGVNLKSKTPKLDTSEKAWAKGIDQLIAEKTKLKEKENMSKNNTATKRKKRRKRKAKQLQKEVKT